MPNRGIILLPAPADRRFAEAWKFLSSIGFEPSNLLVQLFIQRELGNDRIHHQDRVVSDVLFYMQLMDHDYRTHGEELTVDQWNLARNCHMALVLGDPCVEDVVGSFVEIAWNAMTFNNLYIRHLNTVNAFHIKNSYECFTVPAGSIAIMVESLP